MATGRINQIRCCVLSAGVVLIVVIPAPGEARLAHSLRVWGQWSGRHGGFFGTAPSVHPRTPRPQRHTPRTPRLGRDCNRYREGKRAVWCLFCASPVSLPAPHLRGCPGSFVGREYRARAAGAAGVSLHGFTYSQSFIHPPARVLSRASLPPHAGGKS